jgi:hypothetical protein
VNTSIPQPTALATTTDAEQAITTLVSAFTTDPIIRWFFPDTTDYLQAFPSALRLFSSGARPRAIVDRRSDGAAAVWPGGRS